MGSNPVRAWNFSRSYFQLLVSVVFLAARISYIRFLTTVQIYEFHISKITSYIGQNLPFEPLEWSVSNFS